MLSEVRKYLEEAAVPNLGLEPASCDPAAKWVPNVWSFLMKRPLAEHVGPFSEVVRTSWVDVDHTIRIRLCRPRMLRTSAIVNLYRSVPHSMSSKNRPAAVHDNLLAMGLIVDLLREHGVDDAVNRQWVSRRYLELAKWAVRIGLKSQSAEACRRAGTFSSGWRTQYLRTLSATCRVPLVVPMLSSAIRFRSTARRAAQTGFRQVLQVLQSSRVVSAATRS
jgi:hypothetical protein